MTLKIRNFLVGLLFVSVLGGFIPTSGATHISRPILKESKNEYRLGEKIVLIGWADYNDQPTSDVLLDAKVFQPNGSKLLNQSIMSDEQGYFRLELKTKDWLPGNYRIVITSHCREVHRHICSYRSEAFFVRLRE